MGVVLTHPVGSLKHQKGQRVVEALWGEVMWGRRLNVRPFCLLVTVWILYFYSSELLLASWKPHQGAHSCGLPQVLDLSWPGRGAQSCGFFQYLWGLSFPLWEVGAAEILLVEYPSWIQAPEGFRKQRPPPPERRSHGECLPLPRGLRVWPLGRHGPSLPAWAAWHLEQRSPWGRWQGLWEETPGLLWSPAPG